MLNKILIIGASGSGTTTIGKKLADKLNIPHIETDDLFWIPADPPYTQFRNQDELDMIIRTKVTSKDGWVLSGSPCGWGDAIINLVDLVVFLTVPTEIRINRIVKREQTRFGNEVLEGGRLFESHQAFLAWTKCYDSGDITGRTKAMHENWLLNLHCPVLVVTHFEF